MTLAILRPLLTAALLLAAGAGLVWWGLSPRIGLQEARADQAEQQRDDARRMVDLQAARRRSTRSRAVELRCPGA